MSQLLAELYGSCISSQYKSVQSILSSETERFIQTLKSMLKKFANDADKD